MKPLAPVFALATALALGVASARAQSPEPENAPDSADHDQAPQKAHDRATQARDKAAHDAQAALDKASRIAREAMDKVSHAWDEKAQQQVERALQLAQAKTWPSAPADLDAAEAGDLFVNDNVNWTSFNPAVHGMVQPLIVRTSEPESGTVSNIQEDLTVMSRILTKTIERHFGRDSAMGIELSTLSAARRPQSMYLEGYGAVFLVNVRFPLVPPPAKDEEKGEKGADSTWEKTKQELYGTGAGDGVQRLWMVNTVNAPALEYNVEQVDNLKSVLLESLKNAANIRSVKPEESITIVAIGNRAANATVRVKHAPKKSATNLEENADEPTTKPAKKPATATRRVDVYTKDGGRLSARESTLTVRVKKSDVDAFAKGTLDMDELKKRASISAY
jgi:hypothetical protein